MNSFDGRLYRAALSLFPGAFRRDHGAEMARDFDEARDETADSGSALWLLRCCMAIDLVRTLAVQWVRTGLPIVAVASIFLSLAVAEALATVVQSVRVRIPDGVEHDDIVVVLFMVEICVVVIAMTIFISLWVGRLMRPRRR
jgi:small basic protein